MGIGGRIHHNAVNAFFLRRPDEINNVPLVVGLKIDQLASEFRSRFAKMCDNGRKRIGAVDSRLTHSQQLQIRPIYQ